MNTLSVLISVSCCFLLGVPLSLGSVNPNSTTSFSAEDVQLALTNPTTPNSTTISLSSGTTITELFLTLGLESTTRSTGTGNTSSGANKRNQKPRVEKTCTDSKVSYDKYVSHHSWRIRNLVPYLTYLDKFQSDFDLSSEAKFNSVPFGGKWEFQLCKSKETSLELRASYKFSSTHAAAKRITFDIGVTLMLDGDTVQLPLQISSNPVSIGLGGQSQITADLEEKEQSQLLSQVNNTVFKINSTLTGETETVHFLNSEKAEDEKLTSQPEPGLNEEILYDWVHLFVWKDFQSKLQAFVESPTSSLNSRDVELQFSMNSYAHNIPQTVHVECDDFEALRWEGTSDEDKDDGEFDVKAMRQDPFPPFYHNLYTIMTDFRYTDLILKTGEEEFQVHRVIFANTSPVFATMIFNKTFDKNESLIDLGEEIGSDVVEELIRYIYIGKVDDVEEIADRLIVSAHTFALPQLKRLCENALLKNLKMENAFQMYALGNDVNSTKITRRAFAVMKENKGKIVTQSEDFRKLSVHYPNLMYELFLS